LFTQLVPHSHVAGTRIHVHQLAAIVEVLSDRLSTLVDYGVMYREPHQDPGRRTRFAYHLTDAGRELRPG
jgi:DNA-binding HxlR family transcriptional regulator